MAFFKFRQRGQPQGEPRNRAAAPDAAGPTETVGSLRRRALHRLIGAFVLVLVAVIGFPLLFDTQPRPVAVNAPIAIPDKDHVPPLRAPQPPASSSRLNASAGLSAGEEVVALAPTRASAPAAAPASAAVPARVSMPATPAAAASARAPASAATPAASRATVASQPVPSRREAEARTRREQAEAARVRALLEGRASSSAAPPVSAGAGRLVVQLGAFADADKARQVRQQAERAGVKTYVQVVDTKDGKRTRVRAGPFGSRVEAERAAAALKKAGLSGSILTL
jgi:DedD protein